MCSWAVIVCRDKSAHMTVYLASLLSQQIPYTYSAGHHTFQKFEMPYLANANS